MRQTTPRQQAASRANGAQSRGPKTAAGKRPSSRTGCKHNLRYWWSSLPDAFATNGGIHQFSRIAPLLPASDPKFLANLANYRARFHAAFAFDHPSLHLLQRMDARYGRRIVSALDTLAGEENSPCAPSATAPAPPGPRCRPLHTAGA